MANAVPSLLTSLSATIPQRFDGFSSGASRRASVRDPERADPVDRVDIRALTGFARGGNGSPRPAPLTYSAPRHALDARDWASTLSSAMGIGDLRAGIERGLDALFDADPEQAKRLSLLLSVLSRLLGDNAGPVLEKIYRALQAFSEAMGAADPAASADIGQAVADAASAAQAQSQTAQGQTQIIHFELDFEIEQTTDLSSIVAELRDQGIDVRAMRVETTTRFSIHIEFTAVQQVQKSDPLVLDLGGDGIDLTGIEDGQDFDIDADGRVDRTAFVRGNDAFLALDRNANGQIDNGSELFGDQNGALNGLEELAKYDDNADGAIDARDAVYRDLRLLYDANGDGRVAPDELATLAQQGIESIDLRANAAGATRDDAHGNTLAERTAYTRSDGSQGSVTDVWLTYRTAA